MALPPGLMILYDDAAQAASVDCDCACPAPLPATPLVEGVAALRRHPGLRQLSLDAEHAVAFVPSHSRVAVLNHAAAALLDSFAAPRQSESGEQAEAAALYQRLGFLVPEDGVLVPPPPPDTLVAWLHVTNACNLRCSYCYVNKSDEAMDADIALAAIDATLRSAQRYGYPKALLKYAGGEASLNMPLVAQMHGYALERAAAAGVEVAGVVLSNGTALTRSKLTQMRALGLRLMISLDGMAQEHDRQRPLLNGRGSFAAVLAGIERAQEAGLTPDISITITGQSVSGLPDLLRWLLARDLPFALNFYRPTDGSRSFAELQLDEQRIITGLRAAYAVIMERPPRRSLLGALLDRANLSGAHSRTCAVGENYLVIDHQGRIAKCQMELARPVTSIAAADPLAVIRADQIGVQNLPVDQKAGCRDCEWRYWCAGGCAVATFRATGRYDVQSPNCGIYQALYPDVLRLEGSRLLYHHRLRRPTHD